MPQGKSEMARLLNHAGAIGLLCELSTQLRHSADRDEQLDSIERCVTDFAKITGGSVRRVLHRIEYSPPAPATEEPATGQIPLTLVQTCGACPEQYDAKLENGSVVGYLRLRHGYFYAACPGVGGEVVYRADTLGDGVFDDSERETHLTKAKNAIERWVLKSGGALLQSGTKGAE